MSFSRRRNPRALRKRSRLNKKDGIRIPFKYNINWTYPTILICAIAFLVLTYLCQYAQLISVQYRIGKLKAQKRALIKEKKELKIAIEDFESLERIEKIAVNRLNMVYPSQRYILTEKNSVSSSQTAQEDYKGLCVSSISNE